MPANEISLHGNNKSRSELAAAIAAGVGKIIVDNDHEIDLLAKLNSTIATPVMVMIRVNPGVDVHTHRKISTGVADSKFGFPIADGQAEAAIARLQAIPGVRLVGLHAHVGSQLMDTEATTGAIDSLLAFAAGMRAAHGFVLEHLSPGGGFGITYTDADQPLPVASWAEALATAVRQGCERFDLELPALTIEPGRAIIGPAGVGLYTIGSTKALPGIRTYVSVDGGMADNIRPALYEAKYEAALVNQSTSSSSTTPVTIAGKFCESGDLLIEGLEMPELSTGELLAIPAAGAYTLAMASNYNAAPRPAVVLVHDGNMHCVRTRETWQDLVQRERVPRHLTS
jgi:diaminopimelate decarboxylase